MRLVLVVEIGPLITARDWWRPHRSPLEGKAQLILALAADCLTKSADRLSRTRFSLPAQVVYHLEEVLDHVRIPDPVAGNCRKGRAGHFFQSVHVAQNAQIPAVVETHGRGHVPISQVIECFAEPVDAVKSGRRVIDAG